MLFLLSGEGPSDLGHYVIDEGTGRRFEPGPLALAIDQLIERAFGYSALDAGAFHFTSEGDLSAHAKATAAPRRLRLTGLKDGQAKDTAFFYHAAYSLAQLAKKLGADENHEDVVAILFRDADGTLTSTRSEPEDKRRSMAAGFEDSGFARGVPMMPKPKSEAWLLCALKTSPYQQCAALEDESGNDASPHSLKKQLQSALGGESPGRAVLVQCIQDDRVDFLRIAMPSFEAFKSALATAVGRPDLPINGWRPQ